MKGNRNITEQGTKIGKRKVQKTAKEKLHKTAERITEKEKNHDLRKGVPAHTFRRVTSPSLPTLAWSGLTLWNVSNADGTLGTFEGGGRGAHARADSNPVNADPGGEGGFCGRGRGVLGGEEG